MTTPLPPTQYSISAKRKPTAGALGDLGSLRNRPVRKDRGLTAAVLYSSPGYIAVWLLLLLLCTAAVLIPGSLLYCCLAPVTTAVHRFCANTWLLVILLSGCCYCFCGILLLCFTAGYPDVCVQRHIYPILRYVLWLHRCCVVLVFLSYCRLVAVTVFVLHCCCASLLVTPMCVSKDTFIQYPAVRPLAVLLLCRTCFLVILPSGCCYCFCVILPLCFTCHHVILLSGSCYYYCAPPLC